MQDLRSVIKVFEDLGVDVDLNSQDLNKKGKVDYFRFADGKIITSKGEEIHEEIVFEDDSIGVVIHFKCNIDSYKNDISKLSSEFKEDDKYILKKGNNQEKGLIFYEIPNNQNGDANLEKIMSYDLFVNYKRMHDIVKDYMAKL